MQKQNIFVITTKHAIKILEQKHRQKNLRFREVPLPKRAVKVMKRRKMDEATTIAGDRVRLIFLASIIDGRIPLAWGVCQKYYLWKNFQKN